MVSLIVWVYILNTTLLIVHEIDSAYWKEWELFRIPGGIAGFLFLHVPIVMLLIYGLIEVYLSSRFGFLINLIVAIGGMSAFFIHSYFIRAGNHQFKTTVSQALLFAVLATSILQFYLIFTAW